MVYLKLSLKLILLWRKIWFLHCYFVANRYMYSIMQLWFTFIKVAKFVVYHYLYILKLKTINFESSRFFSCMLDCITIRYKKIIKWVGIVVYHMQNDWFWLLGLRSHVVIISKWTCNQSYVTNPIYSFRAQSFL